MYLDNALENLTCVRDGENIHAEIKFDHLEENFTDKNRVHKLYSKVEYTCNNFSSSVVIPTVEIPYKDPNLGFLLDGVIFSSTGVYSRSPGVVPNASSNEELDRVDIVTNSNSTLGFDVKNKALHLLVKKGGASERKIPIGIFLKAISELPYDEILKKFPVIHETLSFGFPVDTNFSDTKKLDAYPIHDSLDRREPDIESCVNFVFERLFPRKNSDVMTSFKQYMIRSYLNGLSFKNPAKYETMMSLGKRIIGTVLDEDIRVPYFATEETTSKKLSASIHGNAGTVTKEVVKEYYLPKGTRITNDHAKDIRRYDISSVRVCKDEVGVDPQCVCEHAPMLFRARGYKLAKSIEVGGNVVAEGTIIDDPLLEAINKEEIYYLDVLTPNGPKTLKRSSSEVTIDDFIDVINYYYTQSKIGSDSTTQYEVRSRVIYDYAAMVSATVKSVYDEIINEVIQCNTVENMISSLPTSANKDLARMLRDTGRINSTTKQEIAGSDITNIMSRAISDRKATASVTTTPREMMVVQKGQYARLDSFHCPDSDKVGAVQHRTFMSRINPDTGDVEAPYIKVVNGKPIEGEEGVVWLSAASEYGKYIAAWDYTGDEPDNNIQVRCDGDVTTVTKDNVDYKDASPFCDMSVSRMCIPFPEFSQPKRALMATKMNGQALPLIFPERPMISTGAETQVPGLYYRAKDIIQHVGLEVSGSKEKLKLLTTNWRKNFVEYRFAYGEHSFTYSLPFTATDKESLYNYNINVKEDGFEYDPDEIVFYNHSCDIGKYSVWSRVKQGAKPLFDEDKLTDPALALGVNLNVCYKTYGSATIEDAVVISDRLIMDNTLSTMQILKYDYEIREGESFSTKWSAPLHSRVYEGQPIITYNSRGRERSILCHQEGEVIYASIEDDKRSAVVWVATLHTAAIGDKVAGRYGNKSVIAKIVPHYMMPYDPETGITYDILCTPLGLPSRMNLGQILEVVLGQAMLKPDEKGNKKIAVVTPFYPDIKNDITKECADLGLAPKRVFNPVYGKLTDRPVLTGVLYIMKLEQIANLKYAAVGYPVSTDIVWGTPVKSSTAPNGQAIGENESWTFIAAGAKGILNAVHTIYSDDEEGRRQYFDMLASETGEWQESLKDANGNDIELKRSPSRNLLTTQIAMRMFGCDLVANEDDNSYKIIPLKMDSIRQTTSIESVRDNNTEGGQYQWTRAKLPSGCEIINPFWINNPLLSKALGVSCSLKSLLDGTRILDLNLIDNRADCLITKDKFEELNVAGTSLSTLDGPAASNTRFYTGLSAIIELLRRTTVSDSLEIIQKMSEEDMSKSSDSTQSKGALKFAKEMVDDFEYSNSEDEVLSGVVIDDEETEDELSVRLQNANVTGTYEPVLEFLRRMKEFNIDFKDLIWTEFPIIPKIFRQTTMSKGKEQKSDFQSHLNNIFSKSTSMDVFNAVCAFIGYTNNKNSNWMSIRTYFFGKDAKGGKHGRVRENVLSKRTGFSGRVVIVPMEDPSISPFFVGLPWRVVCIELARIIGYRLHSTAKDFAHLIANYTSLTRDQVCNIAALRWEKLAVTLHDFNPYGMRKALDTFARGLSDEELYSIYNIIRGEVRKIVEGDVTSDGLLRKSDGTLVDPLTLTDKDTIDCAVVLSGRQPTLHKKSIRSYFVKLVEGDCMRIHPVVCKGYNADFDGDTMWHLQMIGNIKIEALKTLSVMQDLVSEKDGSYTLELSQDIALGIYCATVFPNNDAEYNGAKGHYHFFDNIEELRVHLEHGDVKYTDACIYAHGGKYYCSTAGRVLCNSCIPDGFTDKPFTDQHGIYKTIMGEGASTQGIYELKYDTYWVTTGIKPAGRKDSKKLQDILLEVYNSDSKEAKRESIVTTQKLYEIGLIASDVVSVSITLDDMSSNINKEEYLDAPRKQEEVLTNLHNLGLITDASKQMSLSKAWDDAKKKAQDEIIKSISKDSNTFYMMYSGARGKPDQVMQTIGFIGTITKDANSDIATPILKGYGEGLSSLNLFQTCYSARIGVISTQAGTKETGYATRQSVYMTSGYTIKAGEYDDYMCEISIRTVPVDYTLGIYKDDGTPATLDDLVNEGLITREEEFDILDTRPETITLKNGKVVKLHNMLDADSRETLLNCASYALPYVGEGNIITEETLKWIEDKQLSEVAAYPKEEPEFCNEAYLPVEYNSDGYTITLSTPDGKEITLRKEELYARKVVDASKYYLGILTKADTENRTGYLNDAAVEYIARRHIRSVKFEDGSVAHFRYKLSKLFTGLVKGRVSAGLAHLDDNSCITKKTLQDIEEFQFDRIPVYTGITCLCKDGICSRCYGTSMSTGDFLDPDDNVGIAASQAMCEPLSQATLNVGHSGGKRSGGVGLTSGLAHYTNMLTGTLERPSTLGMMECVAPNSGYISISQKIKNMAYIRSDDGDLEPVSVSDVDVMCVPNGAYVESGEVLVEGFTRFARFSKDQDDISKAVIDTRMAMLREYNRSFSSLDVSPRNAEILIRAQTSTVRIKAPVPGMPKTKDTAEYTQWYWNNNQKPLYELFVSDQKSVVNRFTGVAGFAFQHASKMLEISLSSPEPIKLNSCLGNIVTGTNIGSTEVKEINPDGVGKIEYTKQSKAEQTADAMRNEDPTDDLLALLLGQSVVPTSAPAIESSRKPAAAALPTFAEEPTEPEVIYPEVLEVTYAEVVDDEPEDVLEVSFVEVDSDEDVKDTIDPSEADRSENSGVKKMNLF